MIIREGKLSFDFEDECWQTLVQYDKPEVQPYRKLDKIKTQDGKGVKAVDILGIQTIDKTDNLVFFEIKDIRVLVHDSNTQKAKINNKHHDFFSQFALKVAGTIAGIIVGSRNSTTQKEDWEKMANLLLDHSKKIKVVLWLEGNASKEPVYSKREMRRQSIEKQDLKKKFKWLSPVQTIIASKNDNPFKDSLKVKG